MQRPQQLEQSIFNEQQITGTSAWTQWRAIEATDVVIVVISIGVEFHGIA